MPLLENLALVFAAGLISDLATGLGAIPFFFARTVSPRWNVILWGFASGIMVGASIFGLLQEGLNAGSNLQLAGGFLVGVVLVLVGERVVSGVEVDPGEYVEADFRRMLLILGVLTVHSFPEGVAIGVAFADLNLAGAASVHLLGFLVPFLALYMTFAISVQNIPEGLALSIPLREMGVSPWRMVGWSIFSSVPQPIGAVLAFAGVRVARSLLPLGFGFAAGAMITLVVLEFLPEAHDAGEPLPGHGHLELVVGLLVGLALMYPLSLF